MSDYTLSERVKKAMQIFRETPEVKEFFKEEAPEPIDPNKRVNFRMNSNGKIRIIRYADAELYEQRGIGKIV